MLFDKLESVTLCYGDAESDTIVVRAQKGCHLRVTDNACDRPKLPGDVVRVEEIENGNVNVGADYLYKGLCWYQVKGKP